ncbi:MAG: ABC-three component system protein [Aestuariivirga sp.]
MNDNKVDQQGATSGRDIVGRDAIYNVYSSGLIKSEKIKELVFRLDKEIGADETRSNWIDSLQFFEEPYSPDGVIGLEAKLKKCQCEHKLFLAMRQKELFVKFLNKYSLYGAAQELLALCLHHVHQEFETHVHPACGIATTVELDQIIASKVIQAVVDEYGFGTFALNHGLVSGMTYWLAERCYVRWHK